jgi:type IV secretion system protein VirB9
LLVAALPAFSGLAAATPIDPRIREVPFEASRVVTVTARAGVATLVVFGEGEHIASVGAGLGADCAQAVDPWCVSWPAHAGFLYVRPKRRADLALTLAVVTDRHAYNLVFEPMQPGAGGVAIYRVVFTYPQATPAAEKPADGAGIGERTVSLAPPLVSNAQLVAGRLAAEPLPRNANYTVAFGRASEDLKPALVFDDGRFTYLKWSGNREIPAVFEIRSDGSEMVVNTHMQGDLVVVDRVARSLMLRSGTAVASIRNETFDPDGVPPVGATSVPGVERVERVGPAWPAERAEPMTPDANHAGDQP